MAGQLVCLTGLSYGPETEMSKEELHEFATYDRVYLVEQATHKMDKSGLYSLTLKVKGSPIDGRDETTRKKLRDVEARSLRPENLALKAGCHSKMPFK